MNTQPQPQPQPRRRRRRRQRLLWLQLGPLRVPVPDPGRLRAHDVHHRALGVGRDLVSEGIVSAFELRTGPPTLGIAALCVGAVLFGACRGPRRVLGAWQQATGCRNAYGLSDDELDVVASWSVGALRGWMGLTPNQKRQKLGSVVHEVPASTASALVSSSSSQSC